MFQDETPRCRRSGQRSEGVLGVEELRKPGISVIVSQNTGGYIQIVKLSALSDWRLSEVRVEKSSLDNIFAELSKKAH